MSDYQKRFLECVQTFLDSLVFATCLDDVLINVDNDINYLTVRHELNYTDWVAYGDEDAHVELQLLEFQIATLYTLRDELSFRIDSGDSIYPTLRSIARRLVFPFDSKYLATLQHKYPVRRC